MNPLDEIGALLPIIDESDACIRLQYDAEGRETGCEVVDPVQVIREIAEVVRRNQ